MIDPDASEPRRTPPPPSSDEGPSLPLISSVPPRFPRRDSGWYQRYISSDAWKTNPARLAELEASGHRCRLCNASREEARLEVHHRTYRNLGCELAEDLTTLCSPCHRDVTTIQRAREHARSPVSSVDPAPTPSPHPLFDYRIDMGVPA